MHLQLKKSQSKPSCIFSMKGLSFCFNEKEKKKAKVSQIGAAAFDQKHAGRFAFSHKMAAEDHDSATDSVEV